MEIEEANEKLSNMHFDDIVKSYCNKVNDIERLKLEVENLVEKLNQVVNVEALTTLVETLRFVEQVGEEYETYYSNHDCKVKNTSDLALRLLAIIETL
jgi:putative heme degradation protein